MWGYPDDFDTTAFPAGRTVAVSRAVGVGIMILSLLIVVACVCILWSVRARHIQPVIISINGATGEWAQVKTAQNIESAIYDACDIKSICKKDTKSKSLINNKKCKDRCGTVYSMQEAVVRNFVFDWFTISPDMENNTARWRMCNRATECDKTDDLAYNSKMCSIQCASNDDVFKDFYNNIVPSYKAFLENTPGGFWHVMPDTINIKLLGTLGLNWGKWRITGDILHNGGKTKFVAYVDLAREQTKYVKTLGYYVSGFYSYNISTGAGF